MRNSAFKHVLVPVDFSTCSERALDLGIDIARSNDAMLTLVHVLYIPPVAYAAYAESAYVPLNDVEREERESFDKLVQETKKIYAKVDGVLVTGKPWRKILETALKVDADLIVMGTTGRTGIAHAVLGSVAEKVVRLSPVPVLTACLEGMRKARRRKPSVEAMPEKH